MTYFQWKSKTLGMRGAKKGSHILWSPWLKLRCFETTQIFTHLKQMKTMQPKDIYYLLIMMTKNLAFICVTLRVIHGLSPPECFQSFRVRWQVMSPLLWQRHNFQPRKRLTDWRLIWTLNKQICYHMDLLMFSGNWFTDPVYPGLVTKHVCPFIEWLTVNICPESFNILSLYC